MFKQQINYFNNHFISISVLSCLEATTSSSSYQVGDYTLWLPLPMLTFLFGDKCFDLIHLYH